MNWCRHQFQVKIGFPPADPHGDNGSLASNAAERENKTFKINQVIFAYIKLQLGENLFGGRLQI